jgi:hypothetical protein
MIRQHIDLTVLAALARDIAENDQRNFTNTRLMPLTLMKKRVRHSMPCALIRFTAAATMISSRAMVYEERPEYGNALATVYG